jgi:hypothetical protein
MDVIVRALMASLMTSHGFRKDTEVILHLQGGPGPNRRIRIDGAAVKGIHAEERSVAGQIAKVLKETSPPKGRWIERSKGIWDSRGDIQDTIEDWSQATIVALDASAERLWNNDSIIPMQSNPLSNFQELGENLSVEGIDIGFILSDDKPLESDLPPSVKLRSLGDIWLQGHMAIGICHFLMDEGVSLNL